HTACIWTGYSAGHAIACGNGKEEGCDSEGLLAFMREFAGRRSRSSGASYERKESRARSEVLSRSSQQVGAGRGREARDLANSARCRGESATCRLWAVHRAWSWIAWAGGSWNLGYESQFQRTHGIARCAVLPGKRGSGRGVGRGRLYLRTTRNGGSRTG